MTPYPEPSAAAWSFFIMMLTHIPRQAMAYGYLPLQRSYLSKTESAMGYES